MAYYLVEKKINFKKEVVTLNLHRRFELVSQPCYVCKNLNLCFDKMSLHGCILMCFH